MLAPADIQREGFFEVWFHYSEDRRRTVQATQDPNKVVFPYEVSDENLDNLGSTALIDAYGEEGNDDEDPNA